MSGTVSSAERLPLLVFEDEHLLVANKPAGLNTHGPGSYAGEGIYDWLRHREPRWATLATIQRLDKETSGVMVFAKTEIANRSLTRQFATHAVRKRYLLVTDRRVREREIHAVSALVRIGDRYQSRPLYPGGERAETRFRVIRQHNGWTWVEARPLTGRTHQIRVHAAQHGFPILGDRLYGGAAASRVHLHAEELTVRHPAGGKEMTFRAAADFSADSRLALREGLIDPAWTTAYRVCHGAADGWPGWYVDRLGEFLLSQSDRAPAQQVRQRALGLMKCDDRGGVIRGVYHQGYVRPVRGTTPPEASPKPWLGESAPERFEVRENGVRFELSFREGYSVGLFLDQRDNRRRFLVNHVARGFPLFLDGTSRPEVLNTFAYTCGFSVCAALAGARTTSVDLSRKYLEWGRRNFALNGLDVAAHDLLRGDVFEWLRRLEKKQRSFEVIVLDPPTFSQSREHGVFRAEKDYGELVAAALPLLKRDGVLLAATNASSLRPEVFLRMASEAIARARRTVTQRHYVPQPPDFPMTREEPGHLKTAWLRIR